MKTVEYRDGAVWLIDQTRLPLDATLVACRDDRAVADAITAMRVRGAPAIGVTAAYGVALAARNLAASGARGAAFFAGLDEASARLRRTRPTAVNLAWALDRMGGVIAAHRDEVPAALAERLLAEADRVLAEDEAVNRRMGRHGAALIPDGANVLTHCNAGALACGAYGTALGVLRAAHERGTRLHVWVDETRPLLQGARLTAWELQQAGIPFTLIADGMAAHFMARGRVDLVMVGADRIAANGDSANKIGTYGLAVLAHAHGLPLYFVAPTSTLDLALPTGDAIPIEERNPDEVTTFGGVRVAPPGVAVANPAFDVTPARLITAIVTEHGVVRPPFAAGLAEAAARAMPTADAAPAR
ncbi:MAG TPA: S-methyl-5-thioribose-1-phosphate isomerase [Thermomicrobiales bacterium]|nr:S-methyl-5-thioribose-1-phosphate isomerase [Thermomicrobiales bacterium]